MDVIDPRYEEGKIYIVRCKYNTDLRYIGSTIQTLEERFNCHKYTTDCSLYQYVDGDWDNWFIELYEDYPCKNKYYLELRETEVQREIATINKKLARRTKKEYYQDNREKRLEYQKQYNEDNHDKSFEQKKQYYNDNKQIIGEKRKEKITCECGCVLTKNHLQRHRKTNKHKKKTSC